jgi:hypothetical protein
MHWSGSSFHENADPLHLLVLTQSRTENRFTLFLELLLSGSSFHGNDEPLYLFVLTQFRTENRFTLFLELLSPAAIGDFHDGLTKACCVSG